eukprot:1548371-Rhodomonas_salina.2
MHSAPWDLSSATTGHATTGLNAHSAPGPWNSSSATMAQGACHNWAQHAFSSLEFVQFDSLWGLVDNSPSETTTDSSDP